MSHKQSKKYLLKKQKQAGRREARKEIQKQLQAFESHLRPKPKWVPEKIWRKGMQIFIRM